MALQEVLLWCLIVPMMCPRNELPRLRYWTAQDGWTTTLSQKRRSRWSYWDLFTQTLFFRRAQASSDISGGLLSMAGRDEE